MSDVAFLEISCSNTFASLKMLINNFCKNMAHPASETKNNPNTTFRPRVKPIANNCNLANVC